MECVDGHGPMDSENMDGVEIDICRECGGVWMDKGELKKVLTNEDLHAGDEIKQELKELRRQKPKIDWDNQRKCPVCMERMQKVNYRYSSHVIIDRCEQHGIWLDAGEVDLLIAFAEGSRDLMEQAGEAYAEMARDRGRTLSLKSFIDSRYSRQTRFMGRRLHKGGSLAWIAAYLLDDK